MSENWERSIEFSLKWEGGRNFTVKDGKIIMKGAAKLDAGGATAYGIIIPTLKKAHAAGIVKHADITRLTLEEAKEIYRVNFWEKYGWDKVMWPACLCCLDCSINHGGFAFILQRAAAACGMSLVIDGKFGPKSLAAVRACDPGELARKIYAQRVAYYEKIIARNPAQKVFRAGWLRRAEDMRQAAGVDK